MADVNTVEDESGFPEKRKFTIPNFIDQSLDDKIEESSDSNKKRKLEIPSENNDKNGKSPYISVEKMEESTEFENASAATDDEDDEEDYVAEEDEGDDDGEDSNEESEVIDRKGKGIVLNEKGKGKMIVDSEDNDSSDNSDSNFSDGLNSSDVEDDLLEEIDLDNILPSRTRKRGVQHGVRISNNCENKGN